MKQLFETLPEDVQALLLYCQGCQEAANEEDERYGVEWHPWGVLEWSLFELMQYGPIPNLVRLRIALALAVSAGYLYRYERDWFISYTAVEERPDPVPPSPTTNPEGE